MNKFERLKAALNFEEVDQMPVNLWMHLSAVDQNPKSLALAQVEYARKYDFDFIKLMPFGLYCVEDWGVEVEYYSQVNKPPVVKKYAIEKVEDWANLEVLPPIYGTYGKQLQLTKYVAAEVKNEIPFVQTIFSPLTVARKLGGDRLILDMKENPDLVKAALEIITETTINFVKANIDIGIDGFFFATQCATTDFMTKEEYEEFGVPYDLKVIESYNDKTFFNIVHMHGNNIMFETISKYPVNCLNWHDRWSSPSIAEARKLTDKCILGGIREVPYYDKNNNFIKNSLLLDGTIPEIEEHILEAISEADGKGIILGPGCVASQNIPEKNIYAVRRSVVQYVPQTLV
ncbi:uroporphyrinogen decarboxylase family protein [Psychrobacillus sp. FJAT-21963]|uniref:uroporphyrinogen decarboxylase family protein n=1 Tax=Psychrobacillus sp. FJAT-21963 TaxID=1712028 RepID=UPI0006F9E0D6|nr:uroporphyrinogen decarboxylase family protein [Psychrobacillus sp. FJAT-21963]KQL37631.1 uroporphyrinogen decarboxylase [Psychrobacillus sp. FJAT-21963]